jgi:hypothetical protein
LAAAESAASLTVGLILNPERAARLIQNHARDRGQPDLVTVIDALLAATWKSPRRPGLEGETQRVVEDVVLYELMALAADESAASQVRAVAFEKLRSLKPALPYVSDANTTAHHAHAISLIERFERDPKQIPARKPAEVPPGQPIGEDE